MIYKGKEMTDEELLILFDEFLDTMYPHPWLGRTYMPSEVLKCTDSREYSLRYRQWLATMKHAGNLKLKCEEGIT